MQEIYIFAQNNRNYKQSLCNCKLSKWLRPIWFKTPHAGKSFSMKSEKVNCIDFVLWIYNTKRCKGCFIPLHLCQNKKRLITKEMGPFVGRMYGWSPLLNAFNQVRLLCSTFYASIDSGHAFMKHTIITESKKSKNCSKGPCFNWKLWKGWNKLCKLSTTACKGYQILGR